MWAKKWQEVTPKKVMLKLRSDTGNVKDTDYKSDIDANEWHWRQEKTVRLRSDIDTDAKKWHWH